MFQKKDSKRTDLTQEQFDDEFGILYYQFLKHSFGFNFLPAHANAVRLRFYLDHLPETAERKQRLKGHLASLSATVPWRQSRLTLSREDIVEVDSKDHVILQVVDLVLGAICFRLNLKHKQKNPDTNRRGKRTKAKEKLYKFILERIRECKPGFNIGVSTSGFQQERWAMPYRHWRFLSQSQEKK